MEFVGIAGALGCFGKVCYNIARTNRVRGLLRLNIKSTIGRSYEPYILQHKLNQEEVFKHIMVKNKITEYVPPVYVNVGKKGGLSIPIGGGNEERNQDICDFIYQTIKNVKLDHHYPNLTYLSRYPSLAKYQKADKIDISISPKYNYDVRYLDHRHSVKELQSKYNFDLSGHNVSNSMLNVWEGRPLPYVYIYGIANDDKFEGFHVSDDPELLIRSIVKYRIGWYITGFILSAGFVWYNVVEE